MNTRLISSTDGLPAADSLQVEIQLDFLIPASPTDSFFSQIAMFRLALDALGGIYRQARVVAVLGASTIVPTPDKWVPFFERIDVVWTDCTDFELMNYHATGVRCFQACRPDADLVVICDADTLLLKPFPDLIKALLARPALAGVIAYSHIPWAKTSGTPAADWQMIAQSIIGRDIPLPHRYLFEPESPCPFYVNWGFMVSTPRIFMTLAACFLKLWPQVDVLLENYFSSQVAISLAVQEDDIPTLALPRRYNYANYFGQDEEFADEAAAIVTFHYFSTDFFNRQRIFTNAARFEKFLSLELTGCNKVFQNRIRVITGGIYPFAGADAPSVPLEDAYDALRADLGQLARYAKSLEKALRESQDYSLSLEAANAALQKKISG